MLLETSHHLALAFAGPVLPASKSFILLVGDGYISGYFLGSVFLPDVADLHKLTSIAERDARVEIWRRRWGLAASLLLGAIWVVGEVQHSSSFPIAPADHDLLGAVPLLGIGALIASAYAPILARRIVKTSQKAHSPLDLEHRMGEHFERLFGVVLAAVYVGVWLNPW